MNCEAVQAGENWRGEMFLEDLEEQKLGFDAVENRVSYIIKAFVISEEDSLCRSRVWKVLGDIVGGIPAHGREIVTTGSFRSFPV